MPANEIFRLNYYVSGLLAQGGNLWIDDSKIVFSPTSALDRAMGAKNVEIAFQQIRSLDFAGALSRSFNVSTAEKVHKFEGGQAKKVWEVLEKVLPKAGTGAAVIKPVVAFIPPASVPAPAKSTNGFCCGTCSKPLQPGYCYCPHCATPIKSICKSCRRTIDPGWAACAFCGWKFASNHA
jgi:hypothetical protein